MNAVLIPSRDGGRAIDLEERLQAAVLLIAVDVRQLRHRLEALRRPAATKQ